VFAKLSGLSAGVLQDLNFAFIDVPTVSSTSQRMRTIVTITVLLACLDVAQAVWDASLSPTISKRGGAVNDNSRMLRVVYQGESGAYSDAATRELLGENVVAIGRPSFEDCFRAVASMECEYACLPVENSLGGSIHENYDLMLRYDLTVVGEHEFRVKHCLLAKKGVKRDDIKYAISHPQALAQCDNFLRGLGITPIPTYDTAGSAKMISEGKELPENCTPENTAAIASSLAGKIYGLNFLDIGIEDDDTNFTRFLLLARKGVVQHISKDTPAKTSIVFTLPNTPGALYKALACFSLRDIDFSKIESRPTSASLLNFLKFRHQQLGEKSPGLKDIPRFRYCFYLDFLANELDENSENALDNLREQADYVRILGSYPQKSRLVGPIKDGVEQMKHMTVDHHDEKVRRLPSDDKKPKPLKIGIIGFNQLGQSLARRMATQHKFSCLDDDDKSEEAKKLGVDYYPSFEIENFVHGLDIVVVSVPLIHLEDTLQQLPVESLKGKLLVDTSALSSVPKALMLKFFAPNSGVDLMTSHPMLLFGSPHEKAYTASSTWDGRPMVYEKVRITNMARCEQYLNIFSGARCHMVEMTAEEHDASVADADFVTQLAGRMLSGIPPTPVSFGEYAALCDVVDLASGESFDNFYGMFKFNKRAQSHLDTVKDNISRIERKIAAKEAYLEASAEMKSNDRKRLLAETKSLLREIAEAEKGKEKNIATRILMAREKMNEK